MSDNCRKQIVIGGLRNYHPAQKTATFRPAPMIPVPHLRRLVRMRESFPGLTAGAIHYRPLRASISAYGLLLLCRLFEAVLRVIRMP